MTTPINTTTPQGPYTYNSGITGTTPFITYYSLRHPNSNDVNFPIQKRWVNFTTTPASEWILESFSNSTGQLLAHWVQLTGPGSGVIVGFDVPLGTSPVLPDSNGIVTYTSNGGSIEITGSTNTINYDLPGGYPAIQRLETDDGLFETPTGIPGTIIIHGTGAVNTSQGTAHQVNINISGGTYLESITGDDSVAVVPNSSGNINLFGNVVANATHAKAVYTESPVAHEERIDVQVAAAIASTDITKVGLASFDSAQFDVDANGYVTLVGGGGSFNSINVQVFTTSGTYTPTANMAYCTVEIVGSGGGGGGANTAGATGVNCGGGGGGGGYARKTFTAAAIGASQTITIASGASGGSNTGGNGGSASDSTFGALLTGGGGGPGQGSNPGNSVSQFSGGNGGTASGGDINCVGGNGEFSFGIYTSSAIGVNSGSGGSSYFGGGALNRTLNGAGQSQAGANGGNYGGSGSGGAVGNGGAGAIGGNGSTGVCIITEYIT